jgi:hypothetical protein
MHEHQNTVLHKCSCRLRSEALAIHAKPAFLQPNRIKKTFALIRLADPVAPQMFSYASKKSQSMQEILIQQRTWKEQLS